MGNMCTYKNNACAHLDKENQMTWLRALEGAEDILIMRGDYLSMTNSPYPPHIVGYAVDIYPSYPYLPAERGVVTRVISFLAPRNRPDAEKEDYLININVGNHVLKILHVKPSVKPGDKLYLGDPLGELIISGYLRPWSDPHMHVEVRKKGDELRALGSLYLKLTEEALNLAMQGCATTTELRVLKTSKSYGLAEVAGQLCADVQGMNAVLDAGLPHYGVGGTICPNHRCEGVIQLNGAKIGDVVTIKDNSTAIFTASAAFRAGEALVGVGTYILTAKVKLVVLSGSLSEPGSYVELRPVQYEVKLPHWLRKTDDLHRFMMLSRKPD